MANTVRPGYQTTEFWITLLSVIAGIAGVAADALAKLPTQELTVAGIITVVVSVVSYLTSRTVVKTS